MIFGVFFNISYRYIDIKTGNNISHPKNQKSTMIRSNVKQNSGINTAATLQNSIRNQFVL